MSHNVYTVLRWKIFLTKPPDPFLFETLDLKVSAFLDSVSVIFSVAGTTVGLYAATGVPCCAAASSGANSIFFLLLQFPKQCL